ncbi:DUF2271 domain-containing protein [Oceanobacter sp. 5_MG-2023]|uniref:DUF2271 domain-containing protein n=1 Tax=Oceanobacter sp. 5_MG-2023 TaxID=3062645 RepID=UPI0026E158A9|nr:DUF2271 domain-containing protein [Oceanobacter sp. 5_MG-2023]MDO6682092.1 DUF2271 domain-containing protein [Oceanobacter sp. 5_MG-2023]
MLPGKKCLLVLAASVLASQASATELRIGIELPDLKVAEYHKPYVAIWLENKDTRAVTNLDVWYDADMADNEGDKWLKDMRQWWRKSGRSLDMPVDGITSATRGPGQYDLSFRSNQARLADLPAGNYQLRVEAAREVGGRELLSIPFQWPVDGSFSATANGSKELGDVVLSIQP